MLPKKLEPLEITDDLVRRVGIAFARALARDQPNETLRLIDATNAAEPDKTICHSHDFVDANEYMADAIVSVAGVKIADTLPWPPQWLQTLWSRSWDFAKVHGFLKLGGVRGVPEDPVTLASFKAHGLATQSPRIEVGIPGLPEQSYALRNDPAGPSVLLEYQGATPHLQVLCYEHGVAEEAVMVRYGADGKVKEVFVERSDIRVTSLERGVPLFVNMERGFKVIEDAPESPWEIERDKLPACWEGDRLRLPSGQVSEVISLQNRYDGHFDEFEAYDRTYAVADRLRLKVGDTLHDLWDQNPLTVGSTYPSDFQRVERAPDLPLP